MSPLLAMAYREHRIRLTNPILPFWDILVPVVYLVVFSSSFERWVGEEAFGVAYPVFLLGGILTMVSFSIALNSSYSFFEDLQSGIFHEMLTYPFARRDILLGKLLYNAAFGVLGASLCIAAAGAFLDVPVTAGAAAALILWTVVGTAAWYVACTWLTLRARGFNVYHTTTSALYLLLMFISNLFYPADRLPGAARWLARFNPVTWQVDVLRHATYGAGDPALVRWEGAALLLFILAVYVPTNRRLNAPVE